MKLNFSLKNKEVNLEADVEGIVEKSLEYKSARPEKSTKKTRYQIRHEEKRKNEAQKHKQQEEYDQWRYRYPEFDTTQRWTKVPSQELSDYLVDALKKDK